MAPLTLGSLTRFSGVNTTTPIEGGANTTGGAVASGSGLQMPDAVKTTAGGLAFLRVAAALVTGGGPVGTWPSGWTKRLDWGPSTSPNSGKLYLGSSSETTPTTVAGTLTGPAPTLSRAVTSWAGRTSVLRPSVGSTPPIFRAGGNVADNSGTVAIGIGGVTAGSFLVADFNIDDPTAIVTPPSGGMTWVESYRIVYAGGVLTGFYGFAIDVSTSYTFAVAAGPSAPVNTAAPVISTDGTPQTGETISVSNGTWTNSPTSFAYQWKRDGTDISGATSSTYTLVSADEGHAITAAVTATNTGGSTTSTSAAITGLPQSPVNTVAPALTTDGTPQTGETISVSNGTWTGTPTSYAYQWKRNGSNITGATGSTYTLQGADEGATILCAVTATNAGGSTTTNSNSITGLPQPPANTVAPALTTDGTPQTGETLTTSDGTWTNSPTSFAYQWQRDGVNIAGATAAAYTLVTADETHAIRAVVTANNAGGSTSTASNAVTALPQPPVSAASPQVTGSPFVGEVLTCSAGSWTNSPASYGYQWQRDSVNISGATAATYTLASADNGHAVRCIVTATNAGGSTTAASNAVTVSDAPTLNDLVRFRLSGGDGNTSGQTSTGGARGAVLAGTHGALFADVTGTQARVGLTDYRLVYLENGHSTVSASAAQVFLSDLPDSAAVGIALGVAVHGVGVDVPALPNDRTAPSGVTFTVPGADSALSVGDLAPGEYRGVWVRRTIAPNAPPVAEDISAIAWTATPA